MTNYNPTYSRLSFRQAFTTALMVICLILSSCAVKANVKQLLALQTAAQSQNPNKQNGKQYVSQNSANCQYDQLSDLVVVQKAGFELTSLLLIVFACPAFLYSLLGFRLGGKEKKHPLYRNGRKIPQPVPLFLRYQKLIIYYLA